jgi:hypothetical protein
MATNSGHERLEMWFKEVKAFAVDMAYEAVVPQQLFLLRSDGLVQGGIMDGDPQGMLYHILKKEKPEAFVMVCEARYKVCECDEVHTPDEGCTEQTRRGEIAEDVNNPEALVVIGMARGGEPRVEMAKITGTIPDRDVEDWQEDGAFKGALAEIAMEVMR